MEELSSYDAGSQTPYWPLLNFRGKRSSYWWPGSATARQVFDVSYIIKLQYCNYRGDGVKSHKPGMSTYMNIRIYEICNDN